MASMCHHLPGDACVGGLLDPPVLLSMLLGHHHRLAGQDRWAIGACSWVDGAGECLVESCRVGIHHFLAPSIP